MNSENYKSMISCLDDDSLEKRYKLNKKRIVGNIIIGIAAVGSIPVMPEASLAILGVTALRTYYITKKNSDIEEEIESRGMRR